MSQFATHYNWQRPHQGISCGNRPPLVAFPHLPTLPPVPDLVNPDAWLSQVKAQYLVRRVNRQGFVKVDLYPYYLSSKQAFQRVTLSIQAQEQSLQLVYPQEYRRSLPRVWLAPTSIALSGVPSTHAVRSLHSTAFACFGEVESPLRLIASSTRCRETSPLTKWVSRTRNPWESDISREVTIIALVHFARKG